ncbi:threonine--trna ligase [Quercus suber]|uniref:Threonine--trna ligase n=1 Tax=Quercus suber TaxID=58331 RepID=A0AAW0L7I1_QUESU
MIHRAILGSVERMFAILLEHYKGKWPFWLSPRQAIVCPVSEKSQPYVLKITYCLFKAGYHVDVDTTVRKIQKKVQLISCLALFYLFIWIPISNNCFACKWCLLKIFTSFVFPS